MKKFLPAIALAAAFSSGLLSVSAGTTNIYVEDWGSVTGGSSAGLGNIGWTVVSPGGGAYDGLYQADSANDSTTGSPLPVNTAYFGGFGAGASGMLYTTDTGGSGTDGDSSFTDIDPTHYTNLTFTVEASDEGGSAANYFAIQVGGAWYVSATALAGNAPTYPSFTPSSTPYTSLASAWNQLTINGNGVTIGATASADLSGPITGLGIVVLSPGGWNYNEIVVSAFAPSAAAAAPSATLYSEDWGTATFNSGGPEAGALTDVGWSSSGIAYTGMYTAPGSLDPGTGVTFPPPPLGNITGTNIPTYASMDSASSTGVIYTTDTNGSGADGVSSFSDINPANYPGGVVLNAEAQYNSATHATNYFAVKVGGQWYVSITSFTNNAPANPLFAHNSLLYGNAAASWDTLSFAEGGVNATGAVTVGAAASADLSGAITGVGVVQVGDPGYAGGTTGYGLNYATFSVTTPLVNSGAVAPKIDATSMSQTVFAGGTASFAVDAFVGTAPLTYSWELSTAGGTTVLANGASGTGSFISGATNSVLTISNVSSADAGTYIVEVANQYGADFNTNYTTNVLTVNPLPADVLYAETFPVVGPLPTGQSPATVGWTEAVSSTDNPNRLDTSGSLYAYETNTATIGFFTSTTSDVPGLSGLPFPTIDPTSHPFVSFRATIADPTAVAAGSIYFAVEMAGGQWYASSSAIQLGANPETNNVYGLQFSPAMQEWNTLTVGLSSATIGSTATADLNGDIIGAGLVFAFTGTATEYYVNNFELVTDSTPPVLASFPSEPDVPYSQTVYAGGGASFYFTEAGSLPFTNDWQFNDNGVNLTDGVTATGSIISGSQTTTLTVQNVSGADQGNYDAVVSNPAGTDNLDNTLYGPPSLTVVAPPVGFIYTEAFPLYKPATANQPFSIIGWTNQSDSPNRLFQIGSALVGTAAAYAYEGTPTNSLFYASTASDTGASGMPFIAFDPANYPADSITFSTAMAEGNASYTNVSASFAVEQGGQWYVMATAVEPAYMTTPPANPLTATYTALPSLTYSPLAAEWKTVTLVGTSGVIIGGAPAQNLSGPITAAGLLFQHFGSSGGDINYDSFTIQAIGPGDLIGGINTAPPAGGSPVLTWIGNPAVNLQSSPSLSSPNWQDVPNTLGQHSWPLSTSGSQSYFRLVQH